MLSLCFDIPIVYASWQRSYGTQNTDELGGTSFPGCGGEVGYQGKRLPGPHLRVQSEGMSFTLNSADVELDVSHFVSGLVSIPEGCPCQFRSVMTIAGHLQDFRSARHRR